MHRVVAGVFAVLLLAPAIVRAESPVFVDSLAPQVIVLARQGHEGVRRQMLGPTRPDSLNDDQRMVVMATLGGLESPCRAHLLSKELEPGSPWLLWRSFARVDVNDTFWYVAALSCTDTLCSSYHERPAELYLHDRLALLAIGRDRSRVLLLPPEPAAIDDEGSAVVDSVASIRGEGYTVVQVRRRLRSDHPCYDGGDFEASDEHYFLVLRGDSLVQGFMLVPRVEWDSHDDVDGDRETNRRAILSVTPASIRMNYEVEERQHSPDGDETRTRMKIIQHGVVRLAYDKRTGRFEPAS